MMTELYLDHPSTPGKIADLLANGGQAAIKYGSVYAWVCASHHTQTMWQIRWSKPRSPEKPFGLLHNLSIIPYLIDPRRIAKKYRQLLTLESQKIKEIFGNKGFIRIPYKTGVDSHIPFGMKLDGFVQLFSFEGSTNGAFEVELATQTALMEKFSDEVFGGLVLITSLNPAGQTSITEPVPAAIFCDNHNIPVVVHNTDSESKGSYSIFRFNDRGIKFEREGTGAQEVKNALGMV